MTKKQKIIIGIVAGIALIYGGYRVWLHLQEKKLEEASTEKKDAGTTTTPTMDTKPTVQEPIIQDTATSQFTYA